MKRNRVQKIKKVHIAGIITAVIVIIAGLFVRPLVAKALFDENKAVHIDASSIEQSTLIIGTHLIYLYSLNDELYQIALDSAADSGQTQIYYKSELADGTWFDITDAGSIADITDSGTVVSDDTINNLYFTHHTKSDGKTYDLRTNQAVCIFDINNVYDVENMSELESLKNQYDVMKESGDNSAAMKRNIGLVETFFATSVSTDETFTCDTELTALQSFYDKLTADKADASELEAVMDVMAKVDNERKKTVYGKVDEALTNLLDQASDGTSTDENIEYYELDNNFLTAIADAQSDLSGSMTEAEGDLLEEGSTVLSAMEYSVANSLITNALSNNFSGCEEDVAKLTAISHISQELIVSKESELDLLEELISDAFSKYQDALKDGPSDEYNNAVSNNSSHAVLENIIRSDMADVNSIRSELQFLIKAKTDRSEMEAATEYIKQCISQTAWLTSKIPDDDYSSEKNSSVTKYKEWLNEQLTDLKSDGDGSTGASLYEQKESLQEKRLEALDHEDLDLANLLEAQIETIDGKIAEKETADSDELNWLEEQLADLRQQAEENPSDTGIASRVSAVEARISDITAGQSDGSEVSNIQSIKNDILSSIEDQGMSAVSTIESGVDGLKSMLDAGSPLALAALKEVYQKLVSTNYLDNQTAYDDLISSIEETVADSDVLEIQTNGLSKELAVETVEDILGGKLPVAQSGQTQKTGSSNAGKDTGKDTKDQTGVSEAVTETEADTENETETSEPVTETEAYTETTETESYEEDISVSSADLTGTDLTEEQIIGAAIALAEYARETGNNDIAQLAQGLLAGLANSEKSAAFTTRKNNGESFVPVDRLAAFTGYRYLWNNTKKTAILSKRKEYYAFRAFYSGVENGSEEKEYMDSEAEFSGVIYIPGSYVGSHFDCEVVEVSGTDYSVLANDKVREYSEEILKALSEKGGG